MTDTIFNEDCLEGLKHIPDHSVDLVVTDPPYWHHKSPGKPYSQRNQANTSSKFATSALYNAEGGMMAGMSDFNPECINAFMDAVCPKMKLMNAYMFCSESQVPYYCLWADTHGYMSTILVWEKPVSIINKNRYSQNLEYIVRVYEYGTALNRLDSNVLYNRVDHTAPVKGGDKFHPTQKPVECIEKYILLSSKAGDTILDPFMGSGSTAIACMRNSRHFIGFEMDKTYYDKAMTRIDAEKRNLMFTQF